MELGVANHVWSVEEIVGLNRMRRQIRSWMRPVNPLRAHAQSLITELGCNVRSRRAAAGLSQLELAWLA